MPTPRQAPTHTSILLDIYQEAARQGAKIDLLLADRDAAARDRLETNTRLSNVEKQLVRFEQVAAEVNRIVPIVESLQGKDQRTAGGLGVIRAVWLGVASLIGGLVGAIAHSIFPK
jgi:hypothetical protein